MTASFEKFWETNCADIPEDMKNNYMDVWNHACQRCAEIVRKHKYKDHRFDTDLLNINAHCESIAKAIESLK